VHQHINFILRNMNQSLEETETEERRVVLVVPKQHVKLVKTALEQHGKLDRTTRIVPEANIERSLKRDGSASESRDESTKEDSDKEHDGLSRESMRIPTTMSYHAVDDTDDASTTLMATNLLDSIGLPHSIHSEISASHHTPPPSPDVAEKHPLRKALLEVLSRLPTAALASLGLTPDRLVYAFPESYSIYPPLLLLPHNAFSSPLWKALITAYPVSAAVLQPMWKHIASATGVTCIALNSPIPPSSSRSGANILRSPVNITPIYGSFGPPPTPQSTSSPTAQDLENALWVECTQNGIKQIWAPMYTMFSRGNIREKTRILNFPLPPPTTSTTEAGAVVDMYAGIGYFAYSYRTLGLQPILCFELNPWSVEGLRRGCLLNNWTYKIFNMDNMWEWDDEDLSTGRGKRDFYIFHMSNEHALPLLTSQLGELPCIRHVNLGLLPQSRDSWRDAVRLVGKEGGWIHAHENVGLQEIPEKTREVHGVFQAHLDEYTRDLGAGGLRGKARVEHVERVKMYAPGVVHCVFDVWIGGGSGR
jgi:tRNA wybutosine-synthesizing protein 2